jgi:ABC-type multidrug transport system fused ATPase/permease subunit
LKAFAHEDIAMVKVGARIENYLRSNLKALKIMAIFTPLLDFAAGIGQLIVIYFGSACIKRLAPNCGPGVRFFCTGQAFTALYAT